MRFFKYDALNHLYDFVKDPNFVSFNCVKIISEKTIFTAAQHGRIISYYIFPLWRKGSFMISNEKMLYKITYSTKVKLFKNHIDSFLATLEHKFLKLV